MPSLGVLDMHTVTMTAVSPQRTTHAVRLFRVLTGLDDDLAAADIESEFLVVHCYFISLSLTPFVLCPCAPTAQKRWGRPRGNPKKRAAKSRPFSKPHFLSSSAAMTAL